MYLIRIILQSLVVRVLNKNTWCTYYRAIIFYKYYKDIMNYKIVPVALTSLLRKHGIFICLYIKFTLFVQHNTLCTNIVYINLYVFFSYNKSYFI